MGAGGGFDTGKPTAFDFYKQADGSYTSYFKSPAGNILDVNPYTQKAVYWDPNGAGNPLDPIGYGSNEGHPEYNSGVSNVMSPFAQVESGFGFIDPDYYVKSSNNYSLMIGNRDMTGADLLAAARGQYLQSKYGQDYYATQGDYVYSSPDMVKKYKDPETGLWRIGIEDVYDRNNYAYHVNYSGPTKDGELGRVATNPAGGSIADIPNLDVDIADRYSLFDSQAGKIGEDYVGGFDQWYRGGGEALTQKLSEQDYGQLTYYSPTGVYDNLINAMYNTHYASLVTGRSYLADELQAYKNAADMYAPYITNTNSDGTVDLFVPKGTKLSAGNYYAGTATDDITAKGMKLLRDDDAIIRYIEGGGGYLAQRKEDLLRYSPEEGIKNRWSQAGYSPEMGLVEYETGQKHLAAVKEIAKQKEEYEKALEIYNKSKNRGPQRRARGIGAGYGVGGAGTFADEENQGFKLNKYSLLG